MNLFSKTLLLAALAAGSFGCATSSYKSLGLPPEQVAIVEARPSNFRLVGTDERIQFRELDGEQLYRGQSQGYPTKLDVLPGKHRFVIGFSVYENSSFQESGEVAFDAVVEPGKHYRVDLVDEGAEGWRAALIESTRKELSEEEKRAAQAQRYD